MSKVSKFIVTIVVIVVFIVLFTIVVGVRSDAGSKTPGILGLVLMGGVIGAVRAIWRKGDDESDSDDDANGGSILQK